MLYLETHTVPRDSVLRGTTRHIKLPAEKDFSERKKMEFQLPGLFLLTWNLKLSIKHYQKLPSLADGIMVSTRVFVRNKDLGTTGHTEVEKCDSLSGFFIIMSMAGGTGSGLGAFVTQKLQDQYSSSLKMNQIIWPYGTGEVIVQNYNSILTLSHLYRSSDALLIHENDAVHKICAKRMNIKQISFRDLNQVLAHQLGSVFQPTYSEDSSFHYRRNPLGDLMEHLVPHPEFKMLGVRNIPQMSAASLAYSAFTWAGLLKHLRQMLISSAKMEEGINWQVRPPLTGLPPIGKASAHKEHHFNTSLANLVVLRGREVHSADVEGFKDPALYTSWLEPVDAFSVWKTQRAFDKYEKSAALVSNSQLLVKPLDMIVGKAWNMFSSKAFIHQYTKFGMEEEDFLDSFALLEQVVASYGSLGP